MIYNKKWVIDFYTTSNNVNPIYNYLITLPIKDKARIINDIELLKDYGTNLGLNKQRKISGRRYEGLWELRIRFGTNFYRILYFLHFRSTFVLLHCFQKKSKKTDRRHLETAKKRMKDYIMRNR
jgi:phage-related protein